MSAEIKKSPRRNRLAEISGSRASLWPKLWRKLLNKEQRKDFDLRMLRKRIPTLCPLNVALGAGGDDYAGWLPTDVDFLDITNPQHWERLFDPASIERLLAEHVLEHLSGEQNRAALTLCFQYLKPGGRLRIAVPDGNRKDEPYHGSIKPPSDGHLSLFTVENLPALLESVGFKAQALEYFDTSGEFHAQPWDEQDGLIRRCARLDRQTAFKHPTKELYFTSLLVDAVKT